MKLLGNITFSDILLSNSARFILLVVATFWHDFLSKFLDLYYLAQLDLHCLLKLYVW
jgi:hypothetical protein